MSEALIPAGGLGASLTGRQPKSRGTVLSAALYHGSAAETMAAAYPAASVDMIYLDPPFGNGQVWSGSAGSFDDRWQREASAAGWAALRAHSPVGCSLVEAATAVSGGPHGRGYIGAMAAILVQGRRTLKATGSLWLHHDDTMGALLRVLGDVIFGPANALGTIVWRRASAKATKRRLGRNHDTIAVWGRTRAARWRLWRTGSSLVQGDPAEGTLRVTGACLEHLNAGANERVGYPTQKPVALISRFITAGTLPGDLVLDPTCGSGTTLVAALSLGRRAAGIDASENAIRATRARLPADSAPRRQAVKSTPGPSPLRQLDLFEEAA